MTEQIIHNVDKLFCNSICDSVCDSGCVFAYEYVREWTYHEFKLWVNQGCDLNIAKNVKSLDLSKSNLKKMPDEVLLLENLVKLDLSENSLTEFPNLSSLNLDRLTMNKCNIHTIPIGHICISLTWLELNLNKLTSESFEILVNELNYLELLIMEHNKISFIPENIYKLRKLMFMNLFGNNLCKCDPQDFLSNYLGESDNNMYVFGPFM